MPNLCIITFTIFFLLYAALSSQSDHALTLSLENSFSCTDVEQISRLECEALVDIYNNNDGSDSTPKPTSTPTSTPASTFTPRPTSTPSPTALPTLTPTPVGIITAYEPNNICNAAQIIASNGVTQDHAFQTQGDVDWIKFDAAANTTYRIEVIVPADSNADVALELYPDCHSILTDRGSETFNPSVLMDFVAPATGAVYLKVLNNQNGTYGTKANYQLSVRKLSDGSGNRALIIVAGRYSRGDRLQKNIHHITDQVYQTFKQYGYHEDDIYYLATDPSLTGYDSSADLHNLRIAITSWAAERLSEGGVLNLYMMDHGNVDKFYVDQNQVLTPTDLNSWLSNLESQIDNLTINVIIEACQSGSFISSSGGSISAPGRLVVTSTDDKHTALASSEGALFSDQFISWLYRGYSVAQSFLDAKDVAMRVSGYQEAWIDANGDMIPNQPEDRTISSQRGFNFTGTFNTSNWPPHIFNVESPASNNGCNSTICAHLGDDKNIQSVWAIIYRPSYEPPRMNTTLLPELLDGVDRVEMTLQPAPCNPDSKEQGACYGGTYSFEEAGTYRIVVYAKDELGLNARPVVTEFDIDLGASSHQLYLPVIKR